MVVVVAQCTRASIYTYSRFLTGAGAAAALAALVTSAAKDLAVVTKISGSVVTWSSSLDNDKGVTKPPPDEGASEDGDPDPRRMVTYSKLLTVLHIIWKGFQGDFKNKATLKKFPKIPLVSTVCPCCAFSQTNSDSLITLDSIKSSVIFEFVYSKSCPIRPCFFPYFQT